MMFQYDKNNACYSMETRNIIISCEKEPDVELENYSKMLVEHYDQALHSIAQYICTQKQFIENYGEFSVEETLEKLEKNMTVPWIFLQSDNAATIAYCDEHFVIEFEFEGCFMNFNLFQINS